MKNIFKIVSIIIVTLLITGCTKNKTTEISYDLGKATISIKIPNDNEGNPKYAFTVDKPSNIVLSDTVYLETKTASFGFEINEYTYNQSAKYKEKYKDKDASFEGYLEYIDNPGLFNINYLPGFRKTKVNGVDAITYYNRTGYTDNYTYNGYYYILSLDNISKESKLDIVVNYKSDEPLNEPKELDEETLSILNSLKITPNN